MSLLLVGVIVLLFVVGLLFISRNNESSNDINEKEILVEAKSPAELSVVDIAISDLREESGDNLGMYARNEQEFASVRDAGAKIVNIDQYSTFFVYWLPENWKDIGTKRVLFLLHAEESSAYDTLDQLIAFAKEQEIGLASIQWGWKPKDSSDYVYLDQSETSMQVLYNVLQLAHSYIEPETSTSISSAALLADRYANSPLLGIAFLDNNLEKNFDYYYSIAGAIDLPNPYLSRIKEGSYGNGVLSGQTYYLWCGQNDLLQTADETTGLTNVSSCQMQDQLASTIAALAGVVEKYVQTEEGIATTWFDNPELQKEAFNMWTE